jgi:hypothetical protein
MKPLYFTLTLAAITGTFLPILGHTQTETNTEQNLLLGEFDFSQGGYTIIVKPTDDIYESYYPEKLVVYFDDVDRLNQIKQDLVMEDWIDDWDVWPGTHLLEVCRDGQSELEIEWDTDAISTPWGAWEYRGDFDFHGYRLARLHDIAFLDRDYGLRYLDSLKRSPDLIVFRPEPWMEAEGEFQFQVCTDDPVRSSVREKCTLAIMARFPHETFTVQFRNQTATDPDGWRTYWYNIICSRTLFDQFDLYPISPRGWSTYWPQLTFYTKQ